jgi:hypothetical protein
MKNSDRAEFANLLNLCYSATLRPLPDVDVLELWMTILEPYSIEQVRAALSAHMRESKFPPVPADVVQRMPKANDDRPDANEAWAISLRSRDERDTVVWTQECAEAFAICSSVLEGGDEVGARMAFKAAYERIVERSRAAGKPVQWIKSLGHDPDLREAAIIDAVRAGRLQLADARTVLPALAAPEDGYDSAKAEENLARLRQMVGSIPSAAEKLARASAQQAEIARIALATAKQQAAQRVAAYEASHA